MAVACSLGKKWNALEGWGQGSLDPEGGDTEKGSCGDAEPLLRSDVSLMLL